MNNDKLDDYYKLLDIDTTSDDYLTALNKAQKFMALTQFEVLKVSWRRSGPMY
jgi:hypothetical protein